MVSSYRVPYFRMTHKHFPPWLLHVFGNNVSVQDPLLVGLLKRAQRALGEIRMGFGDPLSYKGEVIH